MTGPPGCCPVLLYDLYQHRGMHTQRVCYTVHNFRHQGQIGSEVLWATRLGRPEHYFHYDRLRDNLNHGRLNLAKAGIVYSNFVTTVSNRHRWEAARTATRISGWDTRCGCTGGKFGGVLNGVDYDVWNPEIDPLIPQRYSASVR